MNTRLHSIQNSVYSLKPFFPHVWALNFFSHLSSTCVSLKDMAAHWMWIKIQAKEMRAMLNAFNVMLFTAAFVQGSSAVLTNSKCQEPLSHRVIFGRKTQIRTNIIWNINREIQENRFLGNLSECCHRSQAHQYLLFLCHSLIFSTHKKWLDMGRV